MKTWYSSEISHDDWRQHVLKDHPKARFESSIGLSDPPKILASYAINGYSTDKRIRNVSVWKMAKV